MPKPEYLVVTKVVYRDRYRLEVSFNDGVSNIVDFEPFLNQAIHPSIQKYLDLSTFKRFTFRFGHLHWNDYEMCFSVEDLYSGHLIKSPLLVVAEEREEDGG